MKRTARLSIATSVAGFSLLAGTASAATFMLQGASGHPHLSAGTAHWQDEWNSADINIIDGRTIELRVPSSGNTLKMYWDVPIPVNSTNRNWKTTTRGSDSGVLADASHRICSFNSDGTFYNCGASVLMREDKYSTVFVPTDGTAYDQSTITSKCIAGGFCGVVSRLISVKAYY
ncbi:MAG: hypothetical protein JW940_31820 [Polyangiaceae bacterium]|nr:hypothetical protein [Polyangiaceae bacterium]